MKLWLAGLVSMLSLAIVVSASAQAGLVQIADTSVRHPGTTVPASTSTGSWVAIGAAALSPGVSSNGGPRTDLFGLGTGDQKDGVFDAGVPAAVLSGLVPAHIETWAYDDGCNGGRGASAQLVRWWVSYAESNCGTRSPKALTDCHSAGVAYCKAVQYIDTNRIYAQGSVPIAQDASEGWWLHQPGHNDASHRLSVSGYGGGSILNPGNSAVEQWFRNHLRANYDSYDAIMNDDTGGSLQADTYGSGFGSSQEITTNTELQSAHEKMASALTHSNGASFLQINNGIGPNPYLATPFSMLDRPSTVNGLISEGVPWDNGAIPASSWQYTTMLDEMAYVDHTARDFMVMLSYDQSGALTGRRVQAGTVLLGYSPGHMVSWSDLEESSPDLAVWPEAGLYPTQPIQTMTEPGGSGCLSGTGPVCTAGGHRDLQVAPGVYRREFKGCYNQGAPIGPCAVIVNTTGSPVTVQHAWLTLSYRHQITLNGGDVQSGGTIDVTGAPFAADSTSVRGKDALLLST